MMCWKSDRSWCWLLVVQRCWFDQMMMLLFQIIHHLAKIKENKIKCVDTLSYSSVTSILSYLQWMLMFVVQIVLLLRM